jgi:hypothetical protein
MAQIGNAAQAAAAGAVVVRYIVCERMTLASGRVCDCSAIQQADLTAGEITELKAAGKTVVRGDGVVM